MNQKSSDQLLESVSALVDNEASELELWRILKNLDQESDVSERWRRYHIIGSALRRERDIAARSDAGFLASVRAGLEQGSPVDYTDTDNAGSVTPEASMGWRSWVGKTAVAASFAAVMVVGLSSMSPNSTEGVGSGSAQMAANTPNNGQPVTNAADQTVVASAPLGFDLPLPESRNVSSVVAPEYADQVRVHAASQYDDLTDVATQELLNRLLIEHAERASVNGSLGLLPFARVSKMEEE